MSYLTQPKLLLKIEYVCENFQRGGMEQDLTHFAVLILCSDSTDCDRW